MKTFETELQKQTEPYIFCKQHISDYEKTIYILALASASAYSLSTNDIQGLADFLEVDSELMSKALDKDVCFPYGEAVIKFGDEVIECGSYYKSDFFQVIVNVFFMYRNLNELFDGTDDEEIIENIHIFRAIMHSFDIANAFAATYECMHKKAFSYDYTMFDSAECFRPNDYINMLITLVSSGDCLKYDKGILCTITPLCSEVNCLHNDRNSCDAYFNTYMVPIEGAESNILQYYDGNLYMMLREEDQYGSFAGATLYKVSLDGATGKN